MGRESIACRVCMKKSKDNVEFEAIFVRKTRITYLEGYNICTQLNAFIGDGLPAIICSYCKDELRAAFRFMEKAKETDRRLREKLGTNRITRSSGRIKQEESNKMADVETAFDEIKTEFINCSKDPLEDSDMEAGEKSEDEIEIHWGSQSGSEMDKDGFAGEKTGIDCDEDEDEDDDKPLKELIKREKIKAVVEEPVKADVNFDSSDVFNDLPEPDNYSSTDENAFNDKMVERIPDPPTTAEAQIFPQGRYMCKLCNKTYFTAAGLKAHIAVHMTKKKKVRRVRGPNKKGKKKKKSKHGDDDDDDEDDGEAEGKRSKSKEEETETVDGEKNDLVEIKDGSTTVEADPKDGKKKRKAKTPKPKKMFPCHVCGKHMISASKLRYHMVMHTGEKDYLCTMCPKAYSTIYALKHHMRTHTGERPYECKFCGDKFTRPTTLKSHMRRHTGERPYGCDICGKRFIQHSSMTTHMKLNHMAKTIACPHCDKKYARQTDLNTHLLSHTGDKPFSCELCPSRFIRQANLNKHMNQHHTMKNTSAAVSTTNATLATKSTVAPGGATITLTSAPSTLPTSIDMIAGQSMHQQRVDQNQNQNQPPLPRVINVRSLAKVVSRVSVSTTVVHGITTSSGLVGTDESNSSNQSNHMLLPTRPSQLPSAQSSQSSHHSTHLQQSHMGPPQHLTNNENSIPMGMNIERIPGGIPTHNMLGAIPISSGGPDHDAGHGRMESVEHLKGIHPPVDNLTNLLGQVIDPERMGRSVDDLIRWNWPHAS